MPPVRDPRRLYRRLGCAFGTVLAVALHVRAANHEAIQSGQPDAADYSPHALLDETALGVPLYPGAKTRQAGQWRLSDALGESAQTLITAALYTDDPILRVKDFYIEALAASRDDVYEFASPQGLIISITREFSDGATTNVLLTENPKTKGTRVSINRMANP